MRRIVWGAGTPRTLRPHWILHELDLPYEARAVVPRSAGMEDPEFLAVSQRHKVPIYQEGDLVVGESGAIVTYLADRHRASHGLIPEPGTPARARHDDWCSFALMELDATSLYVVRRHEGLPDVYGAAPAAVGAAREYFLRQAAVVEEVLADGRPFILGPDFHVADLLLATCLTWARFIGIDLTPALAAYEQRATARPAFGRAMALNFPPEVQGQMRKAAESA